MYIFEKPSCVVCMRAGIRVCSDLRENYTPGHKYSQWELKGACLRIELGPKDMEKKSVVCVRRDTGKKETIEWSSLSERVPKVLEEMQQGLLDVAREKVEAARITVCFPYPFFPICLPRIRPNNKMICLSACHTVLNAVHARLAKILQWAL